MLNGTQSYLGLLQVLECYSSSFLRLEYLKISVSVQFSSARYAFVQTSRRAIYFLVK